MRLSTGERLGHYEIVAPLGAGGMGEVYRVRDSTLRREVAVKILASHLCDADGLRRFQREAEALAALNHPNIAQIHGLHTFGDVRALVMELVEGPTLADRLAAAPLPQGEAVSIARQIADALEAAHERGIVHRDLKPANVKVRDDGTVKVLDFGLAKVSDELGTSAVGDSPTITNFATRAGVLLGTAAYMSPEQARGKTVDKRTDLWSFGCVLYEMLTGRVAFGGDTTADTLSAILSRDPDWTLVPRDTSPSVVRLLRRCLERDVRRRLRDAGDAKLELLDDAVVTEPAQPFSVRVHPWLLGAAALAGALLTLGVMRWRPAVPEISYDQRLVNATVTRLTDFQGSEFDAAVSADGRFVAFRSDRDGPLDVFVTQVGSGRFTNLTQGREDVSGAVRMVGFSPDGSEVWLGGLAPDRRLRTMPLFGGPVRTFLPGIVVNVAWAPGDARLAYHLADPGDPIFIADRSGADPRQIFAHPQQGGHNHYLAWSPDGTSIYFVSGIWATNEMDLWRISTSGGTAERLTHHNNNVTYPTVVDARTLLYLAPADDGSGPWLWALDTETRRTRRLNFGLEKYTSVTSSQNGERLAATVSNPTATVWRVPILGRVAEERDASPVTLPSLYARAPRRGAAESLFYLSPRGGGDGLWKFDGKEEREVWRAANGPLLDGPSISPDGRRAAILPRRKGQRRLHVISADGSEVESLAATLDVYGSASWSPDGQWIAIGGTDSNGPGLFKIPVNGGPPVRLTKGAALNPAWSPDGYAIVYAGAVTAQWAPLLAVQPDGAPIELPTELPKIFVRTEGERVRFLPAGRQLVYTIGSSGAQDFQLFDLATRRSRLLTRLASAGNVDSFDISSDGREILFDRVRPNSDVVVIDVPRQ
jgi:serine/threonine protein kinase/Tol biopolymer transport system component